MRTEEVEIVNRKGSAFNAIYIKDLNSFIIDVESKKASEGILEEIEINIKIDKIKL